MTLVPAQHPSRWAGLTALMAVGHGVLDAAGTAVGVLGDPIDARLLFALARLFLLSILLSAAHLGVLNAGLFGLVALARRFGLALTHRIETALVLLVDIGFLGVVFLGVEHYDNQLYRGMPLFGPVTVYLAALVVLAVAVPWLLSSLSRRSLRPWRAPAAGVAALVALTAFAPHTPRIDVTAPADRPNVIFFVVDTLRAQSMSLYGYERETTPNLDAVAAESAMVFERAYVQYTMSTASHASIYSGCYPFNHGAYGNGWTVPDEVTLISERFRDAGYHTAAFHNHAFLGTTEGFAQGFDTFVETHSPRLAKTRPAVWRFELRLRRFYEILLRRETVRTLMFDWLDEAPRPFFLWLHTSEPHDSYKPPKRLWRKFSDDDDYSGPMDGKVRSSVDYARDLSPEDHTHMKARYDGEIAWFDELFGRLVRRLEALGIDENTLIVLTSDHGECLGEHDCYYDHGELYEESVRVPLVVRFPGTVPTGRIDESVELVDAAATILALSGLPGGDRFCDGRDLSILWRAPGTRLPPAMAWKGHAAAAMDESSKLIVRSYPEGPLELYDLDSDPGELRNLVRERSDEALRLEAAIRELCESSDEALSVCMRTHIGPGAKLDEAALQKLRSLGYVD